YHEGFEKSSESFFSTEMKGLEISRLNSSNAVCFTDSADGYFRLRPLFPFVRNMGLTFMAGQPANNSGTGSIQFLKLETYDTTKTPAEYNLLLSCSLFIPSPEICSLYFNSSISKQSAKTIIPVNQPVRIIFSMAGKDDECRIMVNEKTIAILPVKQTSGQFSVMTVGNLESSIKGDFKYALYLDDIISSDYLNIVNSSAMAPTVIIEKNNSAYPVFRYNFKPSDSLLSIMIFADTIKDNCILSRDVTADSNGYRMEFPLDTGTYYVQLKTTAKSGLVSDWSNRTTFHVSYYEPFAPSFSVADIWIIDEESGSTTDTITSGRSYILKAKGNRTDAGFLVVQLHRRSYTFGAPSSKGGYFDRTSNYIFNFSIGGEPWIYASREDIKGRSIRVSGQRHLYINDSDSYFKIDTIEKSCRVRFSLLPEAIPGEWFITGYMEGNNKNERSYLYRKPLTVISNDDFVLKKASARKSHHLNFVIILLCFAFSAFLVYRQRAKKQESKSSLLQKLRDNGIIINLENHKHRHIVQRAQNFMLVNIPNNISPSDVAAHLGLTSTWIGIIFKEATGYTMVQFINRLKIDRAIELLKSGNLSATDVSLSVGFASLDHFRRVFKEQTGTTPKEFRSNFINTSITILLATAFAYSSTITTILQNPVVEHPTFICAGFNWLISGDDNRNSSVSLHYRKSGEKAWQEGLPLLRIGNEVILIGELDQKFTTANSFAGSLFDLSPGTEYEAKLTLHDPDGMEGNNEHLLKFTTRKEPEAYANGRTLHVYPPGYTGSRIEPSFSGLKEAYYGHGYADWSVTAPPRVQPGDIILIHNGVYKADRYDYPDPYGIPFHGTYVFTKSGTADKPITIKSAGDGEVVFDGDGCYRLFDIMAADYLIFDGLTIRNTEIAFYGGLKDVKGCSGLTVRNCRLENIGIGVLTEFSGSEYFTITDNVFKGRGDTAYVHGWNGKAAAAAGRSSIHSYYAVKVYGRGHVIAHNRVSYFHDGIDVCTHGLPDSNSAMHAYSIDIYNNDIFMTSDDFIEADGGVRNIRVFRNRGYNSAHHAYSAQPIYGGPAYFIRNIAVNIPEGGALKFNNNPSGLIVYHNTFLAEFGWSSGALYSNAHFRNNLFLGTNTPDRPIVRTGTFTNYTSFDYNGYRPNQNSSFIHWKSPSPDKVADYEFSKSTKHTKYASLKEFSIATGHERNGRLIDYDVFIKASTPAPENSKNICMPDSFDLTLRPKSKAIDAGLRLPNINNDFKGKAADLGAYESGVPPPVYGPRK
ncbi:MAG: helix-turn-helix domain-containing protein, partial [Fibrobacteres bacterium]|nr:helix-turn-helix domain-containing protein [Fibrobacterota bacterium]